MRILFTFVGGRGHAEPLVPIARAARAAGHVVAFAGQAAVAPVLESLGFVAIATGGDTIRTTVQPLMEPNPEHEARVLREVFAGFIARTRATDVAAVAERWRPDVVVCDEVDFGAMIAAEALGLPHASVVVIASGTFLRPESVAEPLNELRALHDLPPDPGLSMLHRHLVLVPGPARFRDPAVSLPPTAHLIDLGRLAAPPGHSLPDPPARSRPRVYVTLGTIFNLESGDLFSRVLAALVELPVDVTVTVGPYLDPASLGPVPARVRIEQFIPQAELLPICDAVVCHGGSGTVIGALAHGVPLVLLPMGADQPDNAARCVALGVGIALNVMTATPEDIRASVTTVLTDPAYRRQARDLQAEVRDLPGPEHAVALLEDLV